jgi:putative Holliday junction resolvase
MKILGIDYGTKNIGIAVSDDEARVAFPKQVMVNDANFVEKLRQLIKSEEIKKVVIGDSKNYKMEDNEIMTEVYDLKQIIEQTMEIDVELHSEVLTSMQAEKMMGEKNDMIDASAAAIILQSYLDLQNNKK